MDKCTNEQFWAVATISGMDGFALTEGKTLIATLPNWALAFLVSVATAYAVWFVIQRHQGYYFYRSQLVALLTDEKDVPSFLRTPPRSKSNILSGVTFYVGWVIGLWSIVTFSLFL